MLIDVLLNEVDERGRVDRNDVAAKWIQPFHDCRSRRTSS